VRSIGHFARAAKFVHMVEHGMHRARRNTDHNTVGRSRPIPSTFDCVSHTPLSAQPRSRRCR
jgi:hypothetical protein